MLLDFSEPRPLSQTGQEAINELKKLFETRPDIHFQEDSYFLTKFLRFSEWNVENAFKATINYYEMRRNNAQFYASKNVSEYIDLLKMSPRVLYDKRDKCGRAIFIGKLANILPTTQYTDLTAIDDLWVELLLSDPVTQINGISIIADCKGVNSSILKLLNPRNCKIGASKLESFPVKDWTIHMVNMGSILKACIMLVKPFLNKKTIARFHFHKNGFDELHDFLGKECLPGEYGGTAGSIDYEKSLKFLLSREKMLEHNRQYGFKS